MPCRPGSGRYRDKTEGLVVLRRAHTARQWAELDGTETSRWNTLGPVPDAPGLYCFVGQQNQSSELRVFYVGMTSHLWMVARGLLPGGIARGGQRYGRLSTPERLADA